MAQYPNVNKCSERRNFPVEPVRPLDSDCCGSGCSTCVFDLYELDLKRWRRECDAIEKGLHVDNNMELLSIYEYKKFRLMKVNDINDHMKMFTFEVANNCRLPLHCTQHLIARSTSTDGSSIIRPYTPVSKTGSRGHFDVVVKLYDKGEMSQCIREKWKENSFVEWRGPFGGFRYVPNKHKRIVLIAGGTGVTPMLQLIQDVLENEEDFTRLHLCYSVHNAEQIIMRDELNKWTSFWNFTLHYFVTDIHIVDMEQYKKANFRYADVVSFNKISFENLSALYKDHNPSDRMSVMVCGSTSFNKDMSYLARICMNLENHDVIVFS